MSEKQTHKAAILAHLQSGGMLTHRRAQDLFSCDRLAARICDLRQEGHAINSRKPEGESHAVYWMAPSAA